MKLLVVMAIASAFGQEEVSVYQATEKCKVVVEVTYDGCVTRILAPLKELENPNAIKAIADKAVDRAEGGCK